VRRQHARAGRSGEDQILPSTSSQWLTGRMSEPSSANETAGPDPPLSEHLELRFILHPFLGGVVLS
jgi:hypothetical protein